MTGWALYSVLVAAMIACSERVLLVANICQWRGAGYTAIALVMSGVSTEPFLKRRSTALTGEIGPLPTPIQRAIEGACLTS